MKKIILLVVLLFFLGLAGQIISAQPQEPAVILLHPAPTETEVKSAQVPAPNEESAQVLETAEPEQVPQTSRNMEEGLARKISLDLRNMDIVDTIKFLSMKGDLNIVSSKNVSGRITLFLKDVAIDDALEVILLTNKLACQKKKNIITIMTEEEYAEIYGRKYIDKREILTLKLKYALPSNVGAALENIKSSLGKIVMDDATGTLILMDIPESLKEMAGTARDLDLGLVEKTSPTNSRMFELEYAKVADIKDNISTLLTEGIGSLQSDERTNRLVVQDLPNRLKEIAGIIKAFDAKTRQVIIEAKIVEVTLNDEFALGISWDRLFETLHEDIQFLGNFPISYPSGTTGQHSQISVGAWKKGFYTDFQTDEEAFSSGTMDPRETSAAITFLKTIGKVKIISSPHLAVLNNQEAKIMVGTRQPYATSTISQSETTSTTSWTAEFVDVGVTLSVTPTINKDGFVKMHISPEVSTLTSWFEIKDSSGTSQIRVPEVDTSNAETEILVKNGRTIIIAGLIKDTSYKYRKKIPLLSDIPVIGNLFGSRSSGTKGKELVIFITPHIISGGEDRLYVKEAEKERKPKKE